MEKLNLYRTALDALYFLLKQVPCDLISDSSKVVLRKIVNDIDSAYLKEFDNDAS